MLTFGIPAFLLAGALATLIPLALHLIRRRPPAHAPLPTERFLSPDPRTAVRISRPTDPLLLALRMLLLFLAGAALARPVWVPSAEGTSEIVLLDRSAAMSADVWRTAVSAARQRLLAADGSSRGELVLFDTAAVQVARRHLSPALFDSLAAAPPSVRDASYAAALRSIRSAARDLRGADSIRVTMITRPRWRAWRDGIAPLRHAAWPGAIDLAALPDASPDTARRDTAPGDEKRAIYLAGADAAAAQYPVAALQATSWTVDVIAPGQPIPSGVALIVVSSSMPPQVAEAVANAARGGATVVMDASAANASPDLLPWTEATRRDSAANGLWIDDGLHLSGAASRVSGGPATGAQTIAAWEDGRPAAASKRIGRGCGVFVATDLTSREMARDAAYPRVLERLARGCSSPEAMDADAPLDAGARVVLAGSGPHAVSSSAAAGEGGGTGLGRWVMGVALLVAAVETLLAYRRRSAA